MNKKVIIIVMGVSVLGIMALLFGLLSKQASNSDESTQSGNARVTPVLESRSTSNANAASINADQPDNVTYADPTATPDMKSPEEVTEAFYIYFFTMNNPLANGGYKASKYLSPEFKETVGTLYDDGNTPVFCLQNKRTAVSIGKRQEVYNVYGTLVQLIITEGGGQNKDLYRVLLKNENGTWLIYDINCIR